VQWWDALNLSQFGSSGMHLVLGDTIKAPAMQFEQVGSIPFDSWQFGSLMDAHVPEAG
jgi:hypothetical protein